MATPTTAQDVISALKLVPHPEKGYYFETFRDPNTTSESGSHSTAIYYLLEKDAGRSYWHRVTNAAEIWHYYAGAPLRLALAWDDGTPVRNVVLGKELLQGERPQAVVQKGEWQCATSLGAWTLVGCTVAPAFVPENFEMAEEGWEPRETGSTSG